MSTGKISRALRGSDRHSGFEGSVGIGEMARRFGVSLRTLRFYEHRGLLAPLRENSARFYTDDDATRLRSILRYRQLGFTLSEIAAMMVRSAEEPAVGFFKPQGEQIRAQIAHLEKQREDIDMALSALRREQTSDADA